MEWLWIVLGRECLDLSGVECVRSAFEPLSEVEIFEEERKFFMARSAKIDRLASARRSFAKACFVLKVLSSYT